MPKEEKGKAVIDSKANETLTHATLERTLVDANVNSRADRNANLNNIWDINTNVINTSEINANVNNGNDIRRRRRRYINPLVNTGGDINDYYVTNSRDVNANENRDEANEIFVSIQQGDDTKVKTLLSLPVCYLELRNLKGYSILDMSLLEVYDNQKKPEFWNILKMLLEAGHEPVSIDVLVYVLRSSLTHQEDEFILQLISTITEFSTSTRFHYRMLYRLCHYWPLYEGNSFSDFLESMSVFTIKLIKIHSSKDELGAFYVCLQLYKDSHWESKQRKDRLYTTLVVYLTIAGWKWTVHRDLDYMNLVNPRLAQWCRSLVCKPLSLLHACRKRVNLSGLVIPPGEIPTHLADYLKYPEINPKSCVDPNFNFDSIRL